MKAQVRDTGEDMKKLRIAAIVALAISACLGGIRSSSADGSGYFDGRIVTYIVGSEAGGGYDRYARLIAPYLQKHLSGSRVVVVNRPAGGGIVALNELFSATPDGLTLMTLNSGLLLSQVAHLEGIEFDLAKADWLGKAGAEARILLVHDKAGVKSVEDLRADGPPKVFVTSGFGSSSFIQTKLFSDAFKLNIRVLPGFGGNEAEAALIKGEIDGILTSESNAPAAIKAGSVQAILRFGDPLIEQFKGLPDAVTVATTADQRLVAEKIAAMNNLGRVTLTTPNTDKNVLASLREAYRQALSDPELLAEAERQGLPIAFLDGPATESGVRSFLDQSSVFSALIAKTLTKN
jgi:tripartite-type tricarboxylate transporter receptor subunit TctC